MKKTLVWVVVAVVVIGIGALLMRPSSSGGMTKVDSAGLLSAQKNGAQIVDVRTPGEFQMGHIVGAVNVPLDQLPSTAANWDRAHELRCVLCLGISLGGGSEYNAVDGLQERGGPVGRNRDLDWHS